MTIYNESFKSKYERFKQKRKESLKKIGIGVAIGAAVTYTVVTSKIRHEQESQQEQIDILFNNDTQIYRAFRSEDGEGTLKLKEL